DLVKEHGSPLFVVSENELRKLYQRVHKAFSSRYPHIVFGWSYKTNYLSAICNVLHQEGAWAEVVSAFEYEKARVAGVPGNKIIFNGPHKTHAALSEAIEQQSHIHIDHLDELYLLEEIATEKNKTVNVGIRLNFDTGFTEPWSRFGFNVESGQAIDAAWRIKASERLSLTTLHCHIGTFILEPRAYTEQIKTLCAFMEQVEAETGCVIDTIDIGGGFASHNALQGIYLPPEQVVPSIEQYAEAICDTLLSLTHSREQRGYNRPTLILETGRAMVDESESLITTVVANKRLPDSRRAIIIDAGVNILFTAFWYNHKISPTRVLEGVAEESVIYGPLCMNIDVIRQSIMLPTVNVGDTLVISPVGAYNNTQWMQFIEYRPAVVMVHPDGQVSVIREKENLNYVTQLEHIPEHLQTLNL
ncbi:MAG: alanine racemase, partial [Gammaproteobacteria bacterium]|nr:alanine racemase [Gammaproteobacteria bacterium]